MDEMVKAAMHKWPNVPDCYGWLALDGRGEWWLRDTQAQAAGYFSSPQPLARGDRLAHVGLKAFIGRNYASDADGCWFFQNGPQRVYVELEQAPWVWRIQPNGQVLSHTGLATQEQSAWTDEVGRFYLVTDLGFGLLHSQDVSAAADYIEQGRWQPNECLSADLPLRFGFVLSPQRLRSC